LAYSQRQSCCSSNIITYGEACPERSTVFDDDALKEDFPLFEQESHPQLEECEKSSQQGGQQNAAQGGGQQGPKYGGQQGLK
jgi:hypothetical protein